MDTLKILKKDQSYTFRSYFEMSAEPEDILSDLGYTLCTARLSLPITHLSLDWVTDLKDRLERSLTVVTLTSETARRETLVAPILIEIATRCNARLRIEYPLNLNNWLKGTLDYLLRQEEQGVVIVEAKNDDLTRGFTQLAAELIALSQTQNLESLYGAVTSGEIWRFGWLDNQHKQIIQDIKLYTVPDDLEQVIGILIGSLSH